MIVHIVKEKKKNQPAGPTSLLLFMILYVQVANMILSFFQLEECLCVD